MAETEDHIMNSPMLGRETGDQFRIATEVAAWERKRNSAKARIPGPSPSLPPAEKHAESLPAIEAYGN